METICSCLESVDLGAIVRLRRRKLRLVMALQDYWRRMGIETWPPSLAEEDEAWSFDDGNAQTRLLVIVRPRYIL